MGTFRPLSANDVFESMDRCGAEGVPFLFVLDFELDKGIFIENPLECGDLYFSVRGVTNGRSVEAKEDNPALEVLESDKEAYERGFEVVRNGILMGDTFLINLTAATRVSCNMSLEEIFSRSTAPYRICIPGQFVCFSPEPFVRIGEDGTIRTFPMKGTADAEEEGAERRLLDDYKEICEHYTITDLMRNDLNMVSEGVKVEKFRYVEEIETTKGRILQTSSSVSGQLGNEWMDRIGQVFARLLPAGSISGAPKMSTVELIRKAEVRKRGYYTGVFGYFDGKTVDSAVMIRFIEVDGNGDMWFRSGGGVTVNSDMESEYREVLEKVYLSVR